MKYANIAKKYAPKIAMGSAVAVAAAPTFAAGLIDWSTLATGVTAEATSAITAGITVLVLFLGVAGGLKMFRKFIG